MGGVYVGEHFQNYVHTAVAGRLQDFFLVSRFPAIEDLMRALALGNFESFRRSSCAENLHTHSARDLERRDADAATCAVHQRGFGSVRLRRVTQRMICGSIGHPDFSALLEINVRGERTHSFFERECIFRVCTGEGSPSVYAIASSHFLDFLADRFNSSGAIRSGSVGKRWLQTEAPARM